MDQEKNRFAHDCAFHWLQRQGNTFILKAYSRVYRILASDIATVHIVHTISSHDLVGISILHIHALDVRKYVVSPCGQLFKPSGPRHGFLER